MSRRRRSRSPVHRDARHASRRTSHDNKRARRDSSDAPKKQRNLDRDVPSSASTAKKTSPISKTDSGYGDDRWCPSNSPDDDVFSSLVVTPKVDLDAEVANEKRRKLKAEVKKLKVEKAKYDEENATCVSKTAQWNAKRAEHDAEHQTLSKQLEELTKETTELAGAAEADEKALAQLREELKQLSGETVPSLSISELNVLQSSKVALLDQIYQLVLNHATIATDKSKVAQAAAREAEAARVEMSAIVTRSTHEASECREQVLCVQQVNEELQAKNKLLSMNMVNMKMELKKEIPARMICMQCEARARSVVLLPCVHLAICNGPFCRNVSICPVCKQPVDKRLLINL